MPESPAPTISTSRWSVDTKAADGIRTHDLLHGNYRDHREPQAANVAACRGFVPSQRMAPIGHMRGYGPICSDSESSTSSPLPGAWPCQNGLGPTWPTRLK